MNFQKEFSLDPSFSYLNAGTMSLSPNVVIRAVAAHREEYEKNPSHGLLTAWQRLWELQKELAKFFEANPNDLFLRTNITYAMNDFLFALELPKASEILVSSLEYGAIVNICRHKADLEGHSITTLPVPLRDVSEAKILESFEQAITSKTKLAVFSHVATNCGLVFPIEKMAEIARAKGVVLAIDGAHGVGSLPLSFKNTKVDFYGANLHKWMLGPKGTGFGWVAPSVKKQLKPKFAGWTSYDVQPLFQVFSDPWACRWMISSTHDFSDFYAVHETLEFWRKIGQEKIMARQVELKNYLKMAVAKKTGWKLLSEFPAAMDGPMLAFALPDAVEKKGFDLIFALRAEHRLQISMVQVEGKWSMRFAPHIYNSEEEIDLAANILARL